MSKENTTAKKRLRETKWDERKHWEVFSDTQGRRLSWGILFDYGAREAIITASEQEAPNWVRLASLSIIIIIITKQLRRRQTAGRKKSSEWGGRLEVVDRERGISYNKMYVKSLLEMQPTCMWSCGIFFNLQVSSFSPGSSLTSINRLHVGKK